MRIFTPIITVDPGCPQPGRLSRLGSASLTINYGDKVGLQIGTRTHLEGKLGLQLLLRNF